MKLHEITEEEILRRANEVFSAMENRSTEEEMKLVKKAFMCAKEAHHEQRRKTGEPYIIHPIAVALIVAKELQLGAAPVCAAFLHDVVEDTPTTIEDIENMFGQDVAFLVRVVTKQKKQSYAMSKQLDNFKQMLDSMHYDIRAILIKLADRLHNMRTLDSMRPDKQMKIAGETDFFYAPLAGRLGLYHVKTELENLSFHFRCPREFENLEHLLEEDRIRTADSLKEFTDKINDIFKTVGIPARTQIRYRRPYSIWRTMREEGCDFAHVDFKHFVRVIYTPMTEWKRSISPEKDTTLFIYSCLTSRFKERPGSVSNYIDNPKDNGYQSFHVQLLNDKGSWEELHIASERMHRNARLGCIVERDESWLERFKEVLQNIAQSGDGYVFMDSVSSSLYNEDILAFTPNGKGIILPKGATALDFAFEVHTEIGEHAKFARINGALSPIKTVLHRGDCVEIGTSEDVVAKPEWLSYAKTYKARRRLHDVLRNSADEGVKLCPECTPLPGEEVIGFKDADGVITVHSRHCPIAIKMASENGSSIVSVNFEPKEGRTYPVTIRIVAIDRYHLLRDIIDCFVERQHLSMNKLTTTTEDEIVECIIDFPVHSVDELSITMDSIAAIPSVDEVQRIK
jgi:GTP pyrophosphokinase